MHIDAQKISLSSINSPQAYIAMNRSAYDYTCQH
jgi:hypothetical protein